MPIDLDSVAGVPHGLAAHLGSLTTTLSSASHLELLYDHPQVGELIRVLDEHCEEHGVIGYHFTRTFPDLVCTSGLQAASSGHWREKFFDEYSHRFSDSAQRQILEMWDLYFTANQNRARSGRVWFALTRSALDSGGADRLLQFYGGESVYMPLTQNSEIAWVLQEIGVPVVVACALKPSSLSSFVDCPFGKAWLGSVHSRLRPDSSRVDFDVYSSRSIPGSEIVSVRPAQEYGWHGR